MSQDEGEKQVWRSKNKNSKLPDILLLMKYVVYSLSLQFINLIMM